MDDFDGIGGSYIVDPKTGKRTLVERTQEPDAQEAAEPTDTTKEANE